MFVYTTNPATEERLMSYPLLKKQEAMHLIDMGYQAYQCWRKTDFAYRRDRMLVLANLLRQRKHDYAVLMAKEMGKPITQGLLEIEKCAWVCEHYAKEAPSYLKSQSMMIDGRNSLVCYQPLGIVLAVMPWNYPFWQVFRFATPTLMAGNAAMLKHAPIVTGSGQVIAALFLDAGFPLHLFQSVILSDALVADVIAHEKIAAVTLTGSERAGSIVASEAARYLKKSVLELGGNDPYLVLFDADVAHAAQCIVTSRLNNSGQVCIAAKRVIVVNEVKEALLKQIMARIGAYRMGDPMDPATTLGPMARNDLRDGLHQQVMASIAKGAQLVLGGEIPEGNGYYYPPTVLTDVEPGMPAFDDELFGPVISIIAAKDEAEAIVLANQSRYGLGAAVFSNDVARATRIATEDIDVGSCFVNTWVSSDPRLPFGGIKCSGFGRELSKEGILEFMNVKTVLIHEP